jgi:hypothetical protein
MIQRAGMFQITTAFSEFFVSAALVKLKLPVSTALLQIVGGDKLIIPFC